MLLISFTLLLVALAGPPLEPLCGVMFGGREVVGLSPTAIYHIIQRMRKGPHLVRAAFMKPCRYQPGPLRDALP